MQTQLLRLPESDLIFSFSSVVAELTNSQVNYEKANQNNHLSGRFSQEYFWCTRPAAPPLNPRRLDSAGCSCLWCCLHITLTLWVGAPGTHGHHHGLDLYPACFCHTAARFIQISLANPKSPLWVLLILGTTRKLSSAASCPLWLSVFYHHWFFSNSSNKPNSNQPPGLCTCYSFSWDDFPVPSSGS